MRMLTLEQINLDWLKSADLEELKNAMRSGGQVLGAVNALLVTPEGKKIAYEMMNDPDYVPFSKRTADPEEAAQIAADEAEAARQAAEQQHQADSLAAASADETPTTVEPVAQAPVEEKKKYVIDYQVTDEDSGRPIGRGTHFESFGTEVEALRVFVEKLKAAHINAVRYAERIKNNRLKQSAASLEATERSVAANAAQAESDRLAAEAVNEKDPVKMQEAVKKSTAAARDAEIARKASYEHGRIIAATWMEDHKNDFLACDASSDIIGAYLKANNLVLSYDNLEKAYAAVKHQLPPAPKGGQQVEATDVTTSAVTVDNSPSTAAAAPAAQASTIPTPAAAAAAPASQSQSTVAPPATSTTAQDSTPAAPNQAPAARRPAVNGSLQPGSLSAQRPSGATQQTPAQTRAQLLREIGKMDPAIYRKKLATDKSFREKLNAAGITVVGHRS